MTEETRNGFRSRMSEAREGMRSAMSAEKDALDDAIVRIWNKNPEIPERIIESMARIEVRELSHAFVEAQRQLDEVAGEFEAVVKRSHDRGARQPLIIVTEPEA